MTALHLRIDPSVYKTLMDDPDEVFLRSTDETRLDYLRALAEKSSLWSISQLEVAQSAIACAERNSSAAGPTGVDGHVGYFLLGPGESALDSELESRTREAKKRTATQIPGRYFVSVLLWISASLLLFLIVIYSQEIDNLYSVLLIASLLVPVAASYGTAIASVLPWRKSRLRSLARFRFSHIPRERESVLVMMPVVLNDVVSIRSAVQRLKSLADSDPDPLLRYVLLSDFSDEMSEVTLNDTVLLIALEEEIESLNSGSRDSIGDRFFVLHRKRTWTPTQSSWIGWERKRGKIQEALRFLRRSDLHSTIRWTFGDIQSLISSRQINYVIVLDESTVPAPGAILKLLSAAAHPLNSPVIDSDRGSIRSGYTILQPSISFVTNDQLDSMIWREETYGGGGVPRSGGSSDYFRILDIGIHKGAGALYHIDAFLKTVDRALPINLLLHHDVPDGLVGRTGEVPAAVFFQTQSRSVDEHLARVQRWRRGLFQCLPLLRATVEDCDGQRGPTPISPAARLTLAQMILAELARPACFGLLLFTWFGGGQRSIVLVALACPSLVITVASIPRYARHRRLTQAIARLGSELFDLMMLPHRAMMIGGVAIQVLWRVCVSKKQLLEWPRRSSREASSSTRLLSDARLIWISALAGTLVLLTAILSDEGDYLSIVPFSILWILSPVIAKLVDEGDN